MTLLTLQCDSHSQIVSTAGGSLQPAAELADYKQTSARRQQHCAPTGRIPLTYTHATGCCHGLLPMRPLFRECGCHVRFNCCVVELGACVHPLLSNQHVMHLQKASQRHKKSMGASAMAGLLYSAVATKGYMAGMSCLQQHAGDIHTCLHKTVHSPRMPGASCLRPHQTTHCAVPRSVPGDQALTGCLCPLHHLLQLQLQLQCQPWPQRLRSGRQAGPQQWAALDCLQLPVPLQQG